MTIKSDDRAFVFEAEDGIGDEMQVAIRPGVVHFEIDEPWAGSTETGFGATTSIEMSFDEARELVRWLSPKIGIPGDPTA